MQFGKCEISIQLLCKLKSQFSIPGNLLKKKRFAKIQMES